MKIKIVDPTIDGTLYVENPEGKSCSIKYQHVEIEHNHLEDLPEFRLYFKSYVNVLGKKHNPYSGQD